MTKNTLNLPWMLASDLLPLSLFTVYTYYHYHHHTAIPPPLWGPIISRLFSLIYHAFQPTLPSLIALDHLGICSMAFSVPAACAMAEDGWSSGGACEVYTTATLMIAGCSAVEAVVHGLFRRRLIFKDAEHALIALALVGNAPVLAIIACPTVSAHRRVLFVFSLASFSVGYFALKPRHHALWHWAAAAAQAAGMVAISKKFYLF
jgi:hypothetical protein